MPQGFEQKWFENVLVDGFAQCLETGEVEVRRAREVVVRWIGWGILPEQWIWKGAGFGDTIATDEGRGGGNDGEGLGEGEVEIGEELRRKLDAGLVETLLYWMSRRGLPTGLVTAGERGKAGTEGTAFLGNESQQAVAATSLLFDSLLCPPAQSSTSSDSDSDTDDDNSSIIDTFTNLCLSPAPTKRHYSHGLGQVTSQPTYPHPPSSPASSPPFSFGPTPSASPARSPHRTLPHHAHHHPPRLPSHHHARSRGSGESQTVIEGVSAHLESSDPTIRRLGMLVGELLSAKTAEGGRVLDFGRGVWNGTGEGREEVRVLRALSDAWAHHRVVVEEERKRLRAGGLTEIIDVIGVTAESEVVKSEPQEQRVKRSGKGGRGGCRRRSIRHLVRLLVGGR